MGRPVGRSLQVLISLAGVIMAIVVILQSRGDVRDRLQQRAAARGDMTSRALAAVGRVWHVFAILYVLIFFVVWVSRPGARSEEHTSELQSLMRISYAVFCLKKKKTHDNYHTR